jgi:hypothetical protein
VRTFRETTKILVAAKRIVSGSAASSFEEAMGDESSALFKERAEERSSPRALEDDVPRRKGEVRREARQASPRPHPRRIHLGFLHEVAFPSRTRGFPPIPRG